MIGLDTGFFVQFLLGNSDAAAVWNRIRDGETLATVSCLSLYELDRLGLKGVARKGAVETLIHELPNLCRVIWLDDLALLQRAARIAHGNGLAMADAIILTSFLEVGTEQVYTTDSDLSAYSAGPEIVIL